MEKMVSVEQIREAALELRAKGEIPTIRAISGALGKSEGKIRHYFRVKYEGFGLDLYVQPSRGCKWNHDKIFKQFRRAVILIRESGQLPSIESLACEVGWETRSVSRYLREHPLLRSELELFSSDEALLWSTARILLNEGKRVTRLGLAERMRRSYWIVYKTFKKYPGWIDDLGVSQAEPGSGVSTRRYTFGVMR